MPIYYSENIQDVNRDTEYSTTS